MSFGRAIAFHPLIDLLKRTFRIEEGDSEPVVVRKIEGPSWRSARTSGRPCPTSATSCRSIPAIRRSPPWTPSSVAARPSPPCGGSRCARPRSIPRSASSRTCTGWTGPPRTISSRWRTVIATSRVLLVLTYRPGFVHPFGERSYHTRLALNALSAATAPRWLGRSSPDALPADLERYRRQGGGQSVLHRGGRQVAPGSRRAPPRGRPVRAGPAAGRGHGARHHPGRDHGPHRPAGGRLEEDAPARVGHRPRVHAPAPGAHRRYPRAHRRPPRRAQGHRADLREERLPRALLHVQARPDARRGLQSLLVQRRRELHRTIGLAIEELYADRLSEQYEVLGYHFARGEEWGKALHYLRAAAAKAAARSAHPEAAAHLEQALGVVDHLPEGRERDEAAVDIRLALRNSLAPIGEYGRIFRGPPRGGDARRAPGRQRAARPGPRVPGPPRSGRRWTTGKASTLASAPAPSPSSVGTCRCRSSSNQSLARRYHDLADYAPAVDLFERQPCAHHRRPGSGAVRPPPVPRRLLASRSPSAWRGRAASTRRCPSPWRPQGRRRASGQPRVGPFDRRAHVPPEKQRRRRRCRSSSAAPASSDRSTSGSRACSRSWRTRTRSGVVSTWPFPCSRSRWSWPRASSSCPATRSGSCGGARRPSGRTDRRRDGPGGARARAGPRPEGARLRGVRAPPDWRDHARRDPAATEPAERRYREALALAEPLGMRPLVARCLLGLGALARAAGNRREAEQSLHTATSMFREMGMPLWLARPRPRPPRSEAGCPSPGRPKGRTHSA